MLPRTYPVNSDGKVPIFTVSATGRVAWADYIPVDQVTPGAGKTGRYDEDGAIDTVALASVSGLREWTDYLPVVVISGTARWRTDTGGFIPVTDDTP